MKMKCLYNSILRGDIVKAGTVLDLAESECEMDVVKRFFTKVGDGAAEESAVPVRSVPAPTGVVAGLTRDQAMFKLIQAGVKVKGNISNQNLVSLYEQTFANVAEATAK